MKCKICGGAGFRIRREGDSMHYETCKCKRQNEDDEE